MQLSTRGIAQALHWDRGRLARSERRQARLISQKIRAPTSPSRCALVAGETPAVPVKSLSGTQVLITVL